MNKIRPIVTTPAELKMAIVDVWEQERAAWHEALRSAAEAAGLPARLRSPDPTKPPRLPDAALKAGADVMADFITRIVRRRFEVRLPVEVAAAVYREAAEGCTASLGRWRFFDATKQFAILPDEEDGGGHGE